MTDSLFASVRAIRTQLETIYFGGLLGRAGYTRSRSSMARAALVVVRSSAFHMSRKRVFLPLLERTYSEKRVFYAHALPHKACSIRFDGACPH